MKLSFIIVVNLKTGLQEWIFAKISKLNTKRKVIFVLFRQIPELNLSVVLSCCQHHHEFIKVKKTFHLQKQKKRPSCRDKVVKFESIHKRAPRCSVSLPTDAAETI